MSLLFLFNTRVFKVIRGESMLRTKDLSRLFLRNVIIAPNDMLLMITMTWEVL